MSSQGRGYTQPSHGRAWRPRVHTNTGCCTCRRRKKKCDERTPVCGLCLKLAIRCCWSIERDSLVATIRQGYLFTTGRSFADAIAESNGFLDVDSIFTHDYHYTVSHEGNYFWHVERFPIEPQRLSMEEIRGQSAFSVRFATAVDYSHVLPFDHPSMIVASPTSMLDQHAKHVYRYLCERGHNIWRFPLPSIPRLTGFNLFKLGLPAANRNPGLMYSHLAFAAIQLATLHPEFRNHSLKYYQRASQYLMKAIQISSGGAPPEWGCVTAGILVLYEMSLFEQPSMRVVHLLGFHAFIEARLRHVPNDWPPDKMVLAIYTYTFATQSTFHRDQLVGDKSVNYIDGLIKILNNPPLRPFGPDIMGIPTIFISIAYKLSVLRTMDVRKSPGLLEISRIAQALENWRCDPELYQSYNWERLLTARLYYLACRIYTYKLMNRSLNADNPVMQSLVQEGAEVALSLLNPPVFVLGWPLTILSLAAIRPCDAQALRAPLERLISLCGLRGFKSVLEFIDYACKNERGNSKNLGLDALFDEAALRTVHI